MPILGTIASQVPGKISSTAFESIATVSLSGTQSTITFSNIPSTFKHIQVRYVGLSNSMGSLFMRINSDTNDASYVTHYLSGNGSTTVAGILGSSTGRPAIVVGGVGGGQFSTTYPYTGFIEIYDYASTNKHRSIKTIHGTDTNNSGYNGVASLSSGLYLNTNAVGTLEFYLDGNMNFTANSHFALYGIKGE